jgi:anti-sigma regulatory factor (Ser/Thr protein kinase)
MTDKVHIDLPNSPLAVDKAVRWFKEFAELQGIPTRIQQDMHLALDEVVSNIILYGYRDSEPHRIEVEFWIAGGCVCAEVIDDAESFNLMEREDPEIDVPLEERQIGGLGVYLVKKVMDEVIHTREGGLNRLILKKRFRE